MSPILIRPVREQIEHDRIIRVLQARLRKEFAVEANLGDERRVPVRVGEQLLYPDLVLTSTAASKKVQTIIEVETTESVNHLEAMAEWAHYGRARAPFHLYVPAGLVEIARRLIEAYNITVAQLWSYSPVGDQVHFWLVSGNGDGTIVTSVTDSISSAEPVRPSLPEPVRAAEEAPVEAEAAEPTSEKPKKPEAKVKAAAKTSAAATKPAAPAKPEKPAPAAAPKAEKPQEKKAAAVTTAKPAARSAAKAPTRPAAKPAAKSVRRAPAAKPVPKKAAAKKPAPKKAAPKPAPRKVARPAPARKPIAKVGAKSAVRPKAAKKAGKRR